jgi:hypothetical protein
MDTSMMMMSEAALISEEWLREIGVVAVRV